jgi:hypothetical protein
MRKTLIALCLLAAGATLHAVARPSFLDVLDHPVAPSPCGASMTMQVTPFVFEGSIWMSYLCADNRVIMRQFGTEAQQELRTAGPMTFTRPGGR